MLSDKQNKAFSNFYKSARENDVLDSRTSVLIHMAAAMAVGCYP